RHQREALGVTDDLAGEQRRLHVGDELVFVVDELGEELQPRVAVLNTRAVVDIRVFWAGQNLAGCDTLLFLGRQTAGEHRLGDQRQRRAGLGRRVYRPLASALLPGRVEDQVHERLAGLGIYEAENLRRDFDEVAVEMALVPLGKHRL